MKTVCILTATRAEYGLLKPIIKRFLTEKDIKINIAVTGMHLSPEFGNTYIEIEKDAIPIDTKIDILMSGDSPVCTSKTMALALSGFADYFERSKPDMLLVLGDRYETLAVCCAAMNARIPIAHIAGGESTQGAIDDAIRHSITKMSYLHFTEAEPYTKRVIQLGENPARVFTAGYLGIENILKIPKMSLSELSSDLMMELKLKNYAVVTFHPVTLEANTVSMQIDEILSAVERYHDLKFIFTKSNSDTDGRIINRKIDDFCKTHANCKSFFSLGTRRYLSALQYAAFVLGNSSSGLTEAPALGIPSVNIGDRQKGRLIPQTVISCSPNRYAIGKAIKNALSMQKSDSVMNTQNKSRMPSEIIAKHILRYLKKGIDLKKEFWDL